MRHLFLTATHMEEVCFIMKEHIIGMVNIKKGKRYCQSGLRGNVTGQMLPVSAVTPPKI